MKRITLVVDEKWLEAINNLTRDVYEGEVCQWVSLEEEREQRDTKAVWSMTQAILDQTKAASYEEGMRDALSYLSELFDGVEETDLWADYMENEEA